MFPYKGFAGKWLDVDLTHGTIVAREMSATWAERFLGGNGLGTQMLWENVGPDVDPLGPENLLILAAGPLVGTLMPNSCRMEAVAKSPLTGIYGDANAGGFFGPELKFAGWDAVVVRGQAPRPVYLAIAGDRAELRDAAEIWGQSTSQTVGSIRWQLGGEGVYVSFIG